MKNSKKILIVVTSHADLGNTGKKTGYYLPEVSHPVKAFVDDGNLVDFVSPKGGRAPMDPNYDKEDAANIWFLNNSAIQEKIGNTLRPEQVDPSQYSAIFFAGGTGVMWDFRQSEGLKELASRVYEQGGIVSAVCHGPAALVDVKLSSGEYLVKGKRVAGFSDEEEAAHGTSDVVPFLLETTLRGRGALYSNAKKWQEHVVVDGRLVTGQNPASAALVGKRVIELL